MKQLVIICAFLTVALCVEDIVVKSTYGPLVGFYDSSTGLTEFRGIPYAAPPVGNLRLAAPQPPAKWRKFRSAKRHGPGCMQDSEALKGIGDLLVPGKNNSFESPSGFSEDCLYLDIAVPGQVETERELPVMVWIHGGGFTIGCSSCFSENRLAFEGEVILVAINYRLGTLGFLSSGGDGVVNGNMGLRDAQMALRWVQSNIRRFGGDPKKVTVFGESAGADLTATLVISPGSKGLFRRAIVESGIYHMSIVTSASKKTTTEQYFQSVGKKLGCSAASNEEILECMRTVEAEKFIQDVQASPDYRVMMEQDGLADGLPSSIMELVMSGTFNSVDLMIGFNTYDGALFTCTMFNAPFCQPADKFDAADFRQAIETTVIPSMTSGLSVPEAYLTKLADRLVAEYTPASGETGVAMQRALINIVTDGLNIATSSLFARAHEKAQSKRATYVYEFAERVTSAPLNAAVVNGPNHGDEMWFVFGHVTARDSWESTEREKQLSDDMIRIWAQFAKTGNPNPVLNGPETPVWKEFDGVSERNYLRIDGVMNTSSARSGLLGSKREEFWMVEIAGIVEEMMTGLRSTPGAKDEL